MGYAKKRKQIFFMCKNCDGTEGHIESANLSQNESPEKWPVREGDPKLTKLGKGTTKWSVRWG